MFTYVDYVNPVKYLSSMYKHPTLSGHYDHCTSLVLFHGKGRGNEHWVEQKSVKGKSLQKELAGVERA